MNEYGEHIVRADIIETADGQHQGIRAVHQTLPRGQGPTTFGAVVYYRLLAAQDGHDYPSLEALEAAPHQLMLGELVRRWRLEGA